MSTTPTAPNPFAMPMDQLATAAGVTAGAPAQPVPAAPAPTPVQSEPAPAQPAPVETQPVQPSQPEWGQMVKNEDGTYQINYATGEVFKGTADEVIIRQAEGHVKTKRWGQEGWQKAKEQTAQPPAPEPPIDPQEEATDQWLEDRVDTRKAKKMGLTLEEYRYRQQIAFQTAPDAYQEREKTRFFQMCPDFVDTQQNLEAMQQVFNGYKGFPTAEELKYAWAVLKYEGKVHGMQPVPPSAPAPKPPLMPSSGNTSQATTAGDPWTMPLEDLGRQAGILK